MQNSKCKEITGLVDMYSFKVITLNVRPTHHLRKVGHSRYVLVQQILDSLYKNVPHLVYTTTNS
jgi:hypothetical protein